MPHIYYMCRPCVYSSHTFSIIVIVGPHALKSQLFNHPRHILYVCISLYDISGDDGSRRRKSTKPECECRMIGSCSALMLAIVSNFNVD